MPDKLAALLAVTPLQPAPRLAQWLAHWRHTQAVAGADSFAAAVLGGLAADRVAWAFFAGYQAAVQALVPGLPAGIARAFAATEGGKTRAEELATEAIPSADGWRLSGAKSWVLLGADCDELLVLARAAGQAVLLQVPANTAGLEFGDTKPLAFIPELPHSAVRLHQLALPTTAKLVVPGSRPAALRFRTLEDILVTTASLAYLWRQACTHQWPDDIGAQLFALLLGLRGLLAAEDDVATRFTLDGLLCQGRALQQQVAALWPPEHSEEAARWHRDRPLALLGERVHASRRARGWQTLGQQR
ncbi:acyl-CoA dehydrogenase family protein [Isoalcanivorax beigongshangi]|uniref:Acyl-CoA dehydrogenase family protein n=1 Tax=Isoalcanivorax beigongshangi TaxID=3238810 RepID=A0ABV4AEK0_9GAMM